MSEDHPLIRIDLWKSDAIVLWEWLYNVDFEAIPIQHKAERQALFDLLARLEESMLEPTTEEIATAREEVARDMP
ncbi:hypothetical protein ACEXQD_17430 [Herbiconiux sp. P15]|uniref:hypothetical protein n=1 Tax=Herbiconiux liukaitaii TaxID=3342799 RepID=UPI0035BB9C33